MPTEGFAQLQLQFADRTQWRYEVIRPVILFADRMPQQRAHETQTHPATVQKLTQRFRQQGMLGLLPEDVEVVHRRRASPIPDAVRRELDRLKALCDGFHYRGLGRILLVKLGYAIDDQTLKKLWQDSPVRCQGHLGLWDYHAQPNRYQARMQVIKLYFQGSEKNSIHRLLRVSRPTVDAWIQRFETEHFAGLADRSRAPQAPVRQIWLPLMVQVYHLQRVHPDAGAFRISKPVFNILEGTCEVILVNAQHVKAVPGRKTGVKDAAWLAELLQHGLWRASFIPPVAQRELRDLTRYRSTFIRERVTLINRVQKLLEDANIKLAAVASDIMGVSGRAILAALIAGHTDPHTLAELAKCRLRSKREPLAKALEGRVKPHHRFVLTELLYQIDSLDETVARFDAQIQAMSGPFEAAVGLLDTIPGIARHTAEMIVAEISTDMRRFPSTDHLASWAGVAPGNYESACKRASGKTRKGNRFLRTTLVQAAHAAARTKGTYLSAQYRRLARRRGKKHAILALAHSMLLMA